VETIGSKRSYALIWCMPNNDDEALCVGLLDMQETVRIDASNTARIDLPIMTTIGALLPALSVFDITSIKALMSLHCSLCLPVSVCL